jgi:predicted RNA-binding protein YlxR (DUF448 family)/ribosomal protein L7Ae-like RNA K-turn-binding protein
MTLDSAASTRTCVGCRQRDGREALLRIVLAGDPARAVPDVARRAGGRGVSVHAKRTCLDAAVRGGGLARALRRDPGSTAQELATWAAGQYTRTVTGLIATALRAGKAVLGAERVRDAMNEQRVAQLIVACDAGEGHEGLVHAAERLGRRCLVLGDRASLGRLCSRELVAVMAITDADFAERIRDAALLAAELGGAEASGGSSALALTSAWLLEAS